MVEVDSLSCDSDVDSLELGEPVNIYETFLSFFFY